MAGVWLHNKTSLVLSVCVCVYKNFQRKILEEKSARKKWREFKMDGWRRRKSKKRTREVVVLWGGCDPIVVVLPCVYTQTRWRDKEKKWIIIIIKYTQDDGRRPTEFLSYPASVSCCTPCGSFSLSINIYLSLSLSLLTRPVGPHSRLEDVCVLGNGQRDFFILLLFTSPRPYRTRASSCSIAFKFLFCFLLQLASSSWSLLLSFFGS